ncbi:MAG: sensor histidine kinase [Candidatus Krumholzibacteriia bacterium]
MPHDPLRHNLAERVKELTALHRTARLLQDTARPRAGLMREIVAFLPDAWQFPEIAGARLRLPDGEFATAGFRETAWMQRADFAAHDEATHAPHACCLEICYREARPPADEGPFLREERELIDSLADLLRFHVQHRLDDEALLRARDGLERQVRERTGELERANADLEAEIAEHRRARQEIERYQRQLRRLATELSMAEERERRAIATDLHDHLGQALAFVKLRLSEFAGNAVFCGFEADLAEILHLIDQSIRFTRTLTGELSPPVLYELGLGPALEWLGERFAAKHGCRVTVEAAGGDDAIPQEARIMLFKAAHELLTNAVKHAHPRRIRVGLRRAGPDLLLEVADDGDGFDPAGLAAAEATGEPGGFGLFSIRERLRHLGGRMEVRAAPGQGCAITLRLPPAAAEAPR